MPDEPGAPAEGTAAPETSSSAVDFGPVLDRVGELASTVEGRFTQLEQRFPAPEPQAEPDPWAQLIGGGEPEEQQYFDANGFPVQLPQQQQPLDMQALQNAVAAQQRQALGPLHQQLQQIQIERADQHLGQMIPALANTPENQANRQQAFELVSASLQGYPEQIANALSADPRFIATQWKAAEADRLAAGQAPADGSVPVVEAAGGAAPGGNGEPPNPIQALHEGHWQLPPGLR